MVIYLLTVFVGSIGFGLAFDVFWGLDTSELTADRSHYWLLTTASAVFLTVLLSWFVVQDLRQVWLSKRQGIDGRPLN